LVLVGGCARGWRVKGHPRLAERFEALMVLMRQGWGGRNAAFRQIFTTAFFPNATAELAESWNELQRQTTTPDNAANILSALGDIDIRSEMARIRVPTLVLHSKDDAVVPMSDGVELATGIAGARFVPLDSPNHLLVPDDPTNPPVAAEIDRFLTQETLR
jgi:pimeloyl-ACP methyl ester carboxylesterase